MKKVIWLASILIIFFSLSCEKENNKEMSLKEIFSSLPELESPSTSDMVVGSIVPGNGPIITVLTYKNDTLIQSSRLYVRVVSENFAFGVEGYFSAVFAHKNKINELCFCRLLSLPDNITTDQFDLRSFAVKIDGDQTNIYLRAERWTLADIERHWAGEGFAGQVVYFRYKLSTDQLYDESGKEIKLE
jgi:hypothetical protein